MHAACLTAGGLGMLAIPSIGQQAWLFIPMVGAGLCWASIMVNPCGMLARSPPPERTGVCMGIFNLFIVIPMLIHSVTLPLRGDARNVVLRALIRRGPGRPTDGAGGQRRALRRSR